MVAGEPTGQGLGNTTATSAIGGDRGQSSTVLEARQQAKVYASYTWTNLYVRCNGFVAPVTPPVTSRIGAVNGNLLVTLTGTGVFEDTINSDSLVDQNLINYREDNSGGGGTKTCTIFGSTLADTSTNITIAICAGPEGGSVAFGLTRFAVIEGALKAAGGTFNATESQVQYTLRRATTYSNLRFLLYSNGMDANTTWRTRVDAADGSQLLTISGGATGAFEDTTNSDVVAAASEVAYEIDTTLSTIGTLFSTLSQMKHTSTGREMAAAASGAVAATVDQYLVAEGNLDDTVTEADTQIAARAAFTAKNLMVNITAHGATASDFFLRRNTANSALTVNIPSSSTGLFEDTTNQVSMALTDAYNYFLDVGGSITYAIVGMEQEPSSGGGRGYPGQMHNRRPRAGRLGQGFRVPR